MSRDTDSDPNAGLGRQALKRPLTDAEQRLASCLEQIFKSGERDFGRVAALLQQNNIQLPSGRSGPWTVELIELELRAINESLDRAYATGGRP